MKTKKILLVGFLGVLIAMVSNISFLTPEVSSSMVVFAGSGEGFNSTESYYQYDCGSVNWWRIEYYDENLVFLAEVSWNEGETPQSYNGTYAFTVESQGSTSNIRIAWDCIPKWWNYCRPLGNPCADS